MRKIAKRSEQERPPREKDGFVDDGNPASSGLAWDKAVLSCFERYILLSKDLAELLARETGQPRPPEYEEFPDAYDWLENVDDALLGGVWSYEVHGEHCLFVDRSRAGGGTEIEVFLPDCTVVDAGFFLKYVLANPGCASLAGRFREDGYRRMCALLDSCERKGYLEMGANGAGYRRILTAG